MTADDPLALEAQVCFALAVASRSVISAYREVLEPMGLTHPQYLVMLALWQQDGVSARHLAETLHLEPATLSPLLRRLDDAGMLHRTRSATDERQLEVTLTDRGRDLRERALQVPPTMLARFGMDRTELESINSVLHRIIGAAATGS